MASLMVLLRRAFRLHVDEESTNHERMKEAVWRRVNEQAARLKALDAQIDVHVDRRRRPR